MQLSFSWASFLASSMPSGWSSRLTVPMPNRGLAPDSASLGVKKLVKKIWFQWFSWGIIFGGYFEI